MQAGKGEKQQRTVWGSSWEKGRPSPSKYGGGSSWKKDEAMAVARREEATANRKHVDTMKKEKLMN